MNKEYKLKRTYYPNQTMGSFTIDNIEICKTLELPWLDNERKVSCIRAGKYKVIKRTSIKYGEHFHITNVENRDLILMHSGNYAGSLNPLSGESDILGCILVGSSYQDLNNDGIKDIINSKTTMNKLLAILPNEFELTII